MVCCPDLAGMGTGGLLQSQESRTIKECQYDEIQLNYVILAVLLAIWRYGSSCLGINDTCGLLRQLVRVRRRHRSLDDDVRLDTLSWYAYLQITLFADSVQNYCGNDVRVLLCGLLHG